MSSTRRTFLKHAGTAAMGVAGLPLLPRRWLDPRLSADQLLDLRGAAYDEAEVRALAQRALDVARSAGATFADVRINQARSLVVNVGAYGGGPEGARQYTFASVSSSATIGVRAVIDGAWGFAGGSVLTAAGAERVARLAAALARDGRWRAPRAWEYAAAPAVPAGRWATPAEIDPFTIPVGECVQLFRDAVTDVRSVKGVGGVSGEPKWERTDRLFASTEGSVIVQRTYDSDPNAGAWAVRPSDRRLAVSEATRLPAGGYGYETAAKADLKGEWRRAAEEAARKALLPYKSAEVGRYDLVLGTAAMAGILLPTGRALELDRALGQQANDSGTTFAMPPEDILGKYRLGTAAVTITGDRSRPHALGTIGWDEEGVKPEEFTLVRDGTIVDYVTTRETAPVLAGWYGARNAPVRSHGCAARTGTKRPLLQLPNLTLKPGSAHASVDDLIRDVKRGYYVEEAGALADQQRINVQLGVGTAYEITNGKLGPAVIDCGVQFALPRFWQNIASLGGADSAKLEQMGVDSPDPDHLATVGAYVVPALVRDLNIINTGREA